MVAASTMTKVGIPTPFQTAHISRFMHFYFHAVLHITYCMPIMQMVIKCLRFKSLFSPNSKEEIIMGYFTLFMRVSQ